MCDDEQHCSSLPQVKPGQNLCNKFREASSAEQLMLIVEHKFLHKAVVAYQRFTFEMYHCECAVCTQPTVIGRQQWSLNGDFSKSNFTDSQHPRLLEKIIVT